MMILFFIRLWAKVTHGLVLAWASREVAMQASNVSQRPLVSSAPNSCGEGFRVQGLGFRVLRWSDLLTRDPESTSTVVSGRSG